LVSINLLYWLSDNTIFMTDKIHYLEHRCIF
jgi:hypothetical protein